MDHYLSQIGGRSEADRPLDVEPENLNGLMKIAQGNLVVDAAQNDTIGLFPVPSHATLSHVMSLVSFSALGAGVTLDVGFDARADIAFVAAPVALANGIDVSAAGSSSLVAALTRADMGKKVYELAGLTTDPGGVFWVMGSLKDANPASGTIGVEQAFVAK